SSLTVECVAGKLRGWLPLPLAQVSRLKAKHPPKGHGSNRRNRISMRENEVVILGGARTAIGRYGGGLKDVACSDLGAAVVRESIKRAGVAPEEIEQVVFGNVIQTEPKDMYLSRVAAIKGGVSIEAPALTLNRLCGSGLQAICSAAQTIWLG